jgi:hypothetical protein
MATLEMARFSFHPHFAGHDNPGSERVETKYAGCALAVCLGLRKAGGPRTVIGKGRRLPLGRPPGGRSASGIRAVLDLHGSVVRVAVSPRMAIDYNRGSGCIPSFQLAGALEDKELQSTLADPRLKVLIMTTYGGTGFTDCVTPDYLNPRFYSEENTARIVAEYSDFVYRLHVLFQGSGKRFILANWEGDNAIYCGEAYG